MGVQLGTQNNIFWSSLFNRTEVKIKHLVLVNQYIFVYGQYKNEIRKLLYNKQLIYFSMTDPLYRDFNINPLKSLKQDPIFYLEFFSHLKVSFINYLFERTNRIIHQSTIGEFSSRSCD